jgi:hypothetical protein
MLGCENTTIMVNAPTTADSSAGRSQFPTQNRLTRTTSNTSPGIAKTFSNRAAKDIAGGGGASGGASGGDSGTG